MSERYPLSRQSSGVLSVGDLSLELGTGQARVAGRPLTLTPTEFSLLRQLAEHSGSVLHKGYLWRRVLNAQRGPFDRSLDVHVSNLRRKFAEAGGGFTIDTARGFGYRLAALGSEEKRPAEGKSLEQHVKPAAKLSRRDLTRMILAGPSLAAISGMAMAQGVSSRPRPVSVVNGVRLGIQPFCYHDLAMNIGNRPLLIDAMLQNGIGIVELHMTWVQPSFTGPTRAQQLRDWRLRTPLSYYEAIKKEFDDVGIEIFTVWINFDMDMTEPEIASIYQAAKALGAKGVVGSHGLAVTQRLAPLPTFGLFSGIHNHDNLSDPDAYATEASFEKGLAMSPNIKATLDVRHFTAGDGDCVGFLERHHDRISSVHLGDRRKSNGRSAPFGQGDSPIIEVLRAIRDNKWPITALLEFEHGTLRSSIEEVQLTLDYCKRALA